MCKATILFISYTLFCFITLLQMPLCEIHTGDICAYALSAINEIMFVHNVFKAWLRKI